MWFRTRKPVVSREEALAARPFRAVEAALEETADGGGRLTVEVRTTRTGRWFLRLPSQMKKTFEMDEMGLMVWRLCDGKTSVQQIIRKLAKRYNLNLREAEVPTVTFLRTLVKKGLVGMAVKK
mgnify:CR=1 FL=1|jgi:hypothetical protein